MGKYLHAHIHTFRDKQYLILARDPWMCRPYFLETLINSRRTFIERKEERIFCFLHGQAILWGFLLLFMYMVQKTHYVWWSLLQCNYNYPCLVQDTPAIYCMISGYGHYTRAIIMVSAGSLQCHLHRWNNNPFTHWDARRLVQIHTINALRSVSPTYVII
jgi:hypothetical protein